MSKNITFAIFRTSIGSLTQSNELFSWFNPWIIAPSCDRALLNIPPLISTLVYAILEPIFTKHLLNNSTPPWSLVWGLPPFHLMFCLNANYNLTAQRRNLQSSPSIFAKVLRDSESSLVGRFLTRGITYLTLLFPAITSALINAALLVFSQSLYEPLFLQPGVAGLAPVAMLIFLICRYGDYEIWRRAPRGHLIYGSILQITMFIVRYFARSLYGLPPFMVFQILDSYELEEKFGSGNYAFLEDGRTKSLFVTTLLLATAIIPFTVGAYRLVVSGLEGR